MRVSAGRAEWKVKFHYEPRLNEAQPDKEPPLVLALVSVRNKAGKWADVAIGTGRLNPHDVREGVKWSKELGRRAALRNALCKLPRFVRSAFWTKYWLETNQGLA